MGALRLCVKYSVTHCAGIEHLQKELKFEPLQNGAESAVIDIENSAYRASFPLNNLNQVDLSCMGQVFRIRLQPSK
jgi:hypothetical protein